MAGVMTGGEAETQLDEVGIYANKNHVIRWISYWYGGLVIWNLMVILAASGHIAG